MKIFPPKAFINDWIVTLYNKNQKVIAAFIIKDRLEHEASREAQADLGDADDWTMVSMMDEVKRFAEEHGQGDKEIATNLGLNERGGGFSELLIGLDFIWIKEYKVWVAENSSLYDMRDDEVIQYIKSKS